MMDIDGDGHITKDELKQIMKSLGQDHSDEIINEMF